MHFLTLLIIFFGFVFVICIGLAQVIWDLSETSVHASPRMLATPHSGPSGDEDGHAENRTANVNESSSAADLRDIL
jgi:hypothetical protein